jgi:hypothetical protein
METVQIRYRFMARFGSNLSKPFDDLRSTVNGIFISANMLGSHYWPRQGRVQMTPDEFKKHLEEMHNHEAVFWENFSKALGKEDPINEKLKTIIEDIEQVCRPIIEEQLGIGSILVIPIKKIFTMQ